MANIKIYGVLVNDTTEGIVARADQILDPNLGKTQDSINKEVLEVLEDFRDPTITYDDYVTSDSNNAVKSKGIFQFVDEATSHMPYIGEDGFVYVWDLALGDYVRSGTNLTGPAGETGGTVHLIFDTTLIKINNLGEMYPGGPFRIRVVKQYGETGLDAYTDGCVKWWYNGIENENEPDGWIGWEDENNPDRPERNEDEINSGADMSDFTININPDHHDTITFVLCIDKKGTKVFDQQCIFVIRDPAIYKLDLTNENSMVPMCDEDGKVDDGYFEPSQAILYHGAEMIEPITFDKDGNEVSNIIFSVVSHDGLLSAEIDKEGIITVSGWRKEWDVVNVKVCANYAGNNFYATYTITRVAGMTIYRLHPSSTAIKKEKDGTYNTQLLYANVFKVQASNSGGVNSKISSYAAEGLKVCYVYNNKIVNVEKDIYYLDNTDEGIVIYSGGDYTLPETLDGDVNEVDIYLLKASQPVEKKEDLEIFIDYETVPVVENGDDGFNLYLSNDSCTVNCKANGEQEGYIWDTQALFMRGIDDFSDKCDWWCEMEPRDGLSSLPQHNPNGNTPGYFSFAGRTMKDNIDQVSVTIWARFPAVSGDEYSKIYTITKAKQGQVGESGYKSTVFIRTNEKPDRPLNGRSGGSYESPVPTHYATSGGVVISDAEGNKLKWSDGIPTNSEAMIWASSRLFTTAGGEQDTEWSDPALMADTATFNVEFTYFDPYVGDPDTEPDFWFDPVEDAKIFQEKTMTFMATQNISNGEPVMHEDENGNLSSWVIVRILGEKGEATIKSMVFTRSELCPPTPEGGDFDNPFPDEELSGGVKWTDGLPGGDPMHAIWLSQRTFSTIRGFESVWSTPIIIKDVPGQYDVEYSLVHDEPGDPTSNPENWIDPGEGGLTPEQQQQVWWLAQRWCGIEWSEDGTSPGWSPWDVMKIRGEDGSKAIPRMRGAWEDLEIGDWILSGTSHTDDTGKFVLEEYQDLVYRTQDEVEVCYKCLVSHRKSEDHDPALLAYEQDPKTGGHKSKDGYWLKAEQFEFLSTKLLNARQIITEILSTEKLIVPGSWDGVDGSIPTQVVTENGKIEFKYKNASGNWITLVDIGLDPTATGPKYGILRFYNLAGQAMYDLGPNGLSSSDVESPSVEENVFWVANSEDKSSYYECIGVMFDKASELSNLYNKETGTIPRILLTSSEIPRSEGTHLGYGGQFKINRDKEFSYKTLKLGSFIPQMTIRFFVVESIPPYNVYDPSPDNPNESVWYKDIIQLGKNTIGYWAHHDTYKNTKYRTISLPWINGGESGEGVLTYPIRKWACIYEPFTDINEITGVDGSNLHASDIGARIEVQLAMSDSESFPIQAELTSVSKENESGYVTAAEYSYVIRESTDDGWYRNINLFKKLCSGNGADLISGGYFSIEKENSGIECLYDSAECEKMIKEAIGLVAKTFYYLINRPAGISRHGNGNNLYFGSFSLGYGIQGAFSSALNSSSCDYRMSAIVAKNLLNSITSYYGFSNGEYLGYAIPEDKYFKVISENREGSSYSKDYFLELTSIGEVKISSDVSSVMNLYGSATKNDGGSGDFRYLTLPMDNQEFSRAFLLIDSLSGKMGSTDTETSGAIGNTYMLTIRRDEVEEEDDHGNTNFESKYTITYKAVPKFGAFLERGMHSMPNSYGSSYSKFPRNVLFEYLRGSEYTVKSNV